MEYNGETWGEIKKIDMTTKNNSNELILAILIMVFAAIAFIFGAKVGYGDGELYQQRVAIKAGVAHYVADEQGNSKFEYIKK